MIKYTLSLLIFTLINAPVFAQEEVGIPKWFQKEIELHEGTWITENNKYKSENEPYDQYMIIWEWGIGKSSIKGKLSGLIEGKDVGVFWEFRQYWDFDKNQAILVQYGSDGTIGIGALKPTMENGTELTQKFTTPSRDSTYHGHRSSISDGKLTSSSFSIDENGNWTPVRSYIWEKR